MTHGWPGHGLAEERQEAHDAKTNGRTDARFSGYRGYGSARHHPFHCSDGEYSPLPLETMLRHDIDTGTSADLEPNKVHPGTMLGHPRGHEG